MTVGNYLYPEKPVLLVDDDEMILLSFAAILKKAGINNFLTLQDSREVMKILEKQPFAAVLLDLTMPHILGLELLKMIIESHPETPVMIVTGSDEITAAVDCMKAGAFDFLVKPVEMNSLISSVKKAVEVSLLRSEVSSLKKYLLTDTLENESAFSSIITRSKKMRSLFQYAESISNSQQTVLITGETGTGKELFAWAIHSAGRMPGPFVALNISGLDDGVFSDTLFGHKKGAFTGAESCREGLIAQAENGTLFLDEIGDMNEATQVKLLRLLQEKEYLPLGADTSRQCFARIIAATNRNLQDLMQKGRFRKDLYFRMRAHQLHIPPLRERIEDIQDLLSHFIRSAATALKKNSPTYPVELVTLLTTYHFPGNVRELEAMVYDAVARHRAGILSMESFKAAIKHDRINHPDASSDTETSAPLLSIFGKFPSLQESELHLVSEAMRLSNNNQGIAASLLGITRQALNKRLIRQKKP